MTKVSSSKKKSKSPVDGPGVKKEQSFKKPGKMGSEIDEIFSGKKRKRPENRKVDQKGKADKELNADKNARHNMKKEKKSKKNKGMEANLFAESSSGKRKTTADGLTIYTEEELGIGKADAGGTPLCPFDCDCCF